MWSVWRHGALRTSQWKAELSPTDDEQYARHVLRYIHEKMKEGTVELRFEDVVEEKLTKTRGESENEGRQSALGKEKYFPLIAEPILEPLAAANRVFGPIYQKYKDGQLFYSDMLVETVIALADWNKVGQALEDHLWESGSDSFPTERISTKREARRQLNRGLEASSNHIEQVGVLINLLYSESSLAYLTNRIKQDISFLQSYTRGKDQKE
ncbi:hypothetical protein [Cohnella soli]|uniref:Uncharacterized protein n=1 Tax=Cohnella soli TaxID=425005 RepID=A0ABW0HPF3_9BACL